MKEKILVTGGTGYIGSHTTVELINSGYEVLIIDNLSNSSEDSLDGIEKITGVRPTFANLDLCNYELLEQFFQDHRGIKAIIHFAASKAVGESVEKPLLYYKNNLQSLTNILELMGKYDVPNIAFSSSCTVYGQPKKLPVTEQSPILPAESPYGNTKQICEEIMQDLTEVFIQYGITESTIIETQQMENLMPRLMKPFFWRRSLVYICREIRASSTC